MLFDKIFKKIISFDKILLIGTIIFLLYHFNNKTIEGFKPRVTLYDENTPRWMKLVYNGSSIMPESSHTGVDFSPYLIAPDGPAWRFLLDAGRVPPSREIGRNPEEPRAGVPKACPQSDKPHGCHTLFEPHLGMIPRGYPDIFADLRDSGSINGDIIRPTLDPDDLLSGIGHDGEPFSEQERESLLRYFEGQKVVQVCGSLPSGTASTTRTTMDQYDIYKCDYDENGRLTYIKEN